MPERCLAPRVSRGIALSSTVPHVYLHTCALTVQLHMWGPCEGTYLGRWHVLVCTRGGKLMCHCMCSSIISFLKDSLQINVIKCCWIFIFFKRKLTGRGDALRYCTHCRLCHSALPASAPADGGGAAALHYFPAHCFLLKLQKSHVMGVLMAHLPSLYN